MKHALIGSSNTFTDRKWLSLDQRIGILQYSVWLTRRKDLMADGDGEVISCFPFLWGKQRGEEALILQSRYGLESLEGVT